MSINTYTCVGNLARDAEVRETGTGTPVANFTLAVNDRVRNGKTGEWEDYTNWVRFCMFGERAKNVAPYLKKGVKIGVTSKLRYSEYTDKEGNKRNSIEFIVDDLEFMQRKNDGAGNGGGKSGGGSYNEYDEDTPF